MSSLNPFLKPLLCYICLISLHIDIKPVKFSSKFAIPFFSNPDRPPVLLNLFRVQLPDAKQAGGPGRSTEGQPARATLASQAAPAPGPPLQTHSAKPSFSSIILDSAWNIFRMQNKTNSINKNVWISGIFVSYQRTFELRISWDQADVILFSIKYFWKYKIFCIRNFIAKSRIYFWKVLFMNCKQIQFGCTTNLMAIAARCPGSELMIHAILGDWKNLVPTPVITDKLMQFR